MALRARDGQRLGKAGSEPSERKRTDRRTAATSEEPQRPDLRTFSWPPTIPPRAAGPCKSPYSPADPTLVKKVCRRWWWLLVSLFRVLCWRRRFETWARPVVSLTAMMMVAKISVLFIVMARKGDIASWTVGAKRKAKNVTAASKLASWVLDRPPLNCGWEGCTLVAAGVVYAVYALSCDRRKGGSGGDTKLNRNDSSYIRTV